MLPGLRLASTPALPASLAAVVIMPLGRQWVPVSCEATQNQRLPLMVRKTNEITFGVEIHPEILRNPKEAWEISYMKF